MRIAELSRRSAVPVATIKYYQREGLLPPGELTSPNQARYDERHLDRLRLVRALIEVGRLPVATVRELLAFLDQSEMNPHYKLGKVLRTVTAARSGSPGEADEAVAAGTKEVEALIERRGWQVAPGAPARRTLAEALAALRRVGGDDIADLIDEYAALAERVAAIDLRLVRSRATPEAMVYGALLGETLGDTMFTALRWLAQEDASARALDTGAPRVP
ncbi:MerR family transcriptional regulator [Rhizomonospora bruguierae]|uniref:MerR family transcriptional regulator n=1 Tax=Rhizomonospora bruguierae TaxID=1581705 RepID=UPI001BCEA22D|nr:MerR family transcriptional regulator [Micromonospora sp. NBRC 107566]